MPITDLETATWLNPPQSWSIVSDVLHVKTNSKTDFWQETHYGFYRDDGHFLHVPVASDFSASIVFDGLYEELYDQAGLMVRIDAKTWIKFGIEHSDGVTNFSFVATRGRSDWSVISRPKLTGPQSVRITRIGSALFAHYKSGADLWQLMRLCPFPDDCPVLVGPMACSPQRAGFKVQFSEFRIDPPIDNPLHG